MSAASAIPLVRPGEQRALGDRPRDHEREVGADVGEPAQALRGARPARDHREQHQRQHERRHQQLRAAELHAQRPPAERQHDPALAPHPAAPAPSSCEPVTAANTSSSVGDSTSTDSTTTSCSSSARITGAIAPLPAAVRSSTCVGAAGSGGCSVAERGERRARPLRAARGRPARRAGSARPTRAFSASGVPSATSLPAAMIPTRSASCSASSRYCVVRKTVVPVVVERAHLAPQRAAARRVQARSSARRGRGRAGGARAPARGRAGAACRPSSRRRGGRRPG